VLVIKVLLILGLAVAVAVVVAAAREAGVRFTALLHHGMRVRYRQVCVRPTNRRRRLVGDLQVGGKEMSVAGSWQVWSDVGYDNWARRTALVMRGPHVLTADLRFDCCWDNIREMVVDPLKVGGSQVRETMRVLGVRMHIETCSGVWSIIGVRAKGKVWVPRVGVGVRVL